MPFVLNKATILASLAIAASTARATTPAWGNCKNDISCVEGYYCQPWDPNFYQCVKSLPKCPQQLTNVDFPGQDIKEVPVNQPDQCCDACANTPECTHYTYDNNRPGTPGCYLKKNGPGTQAYKAGLVSGIMSSQPVTPVPSSSAPTVSPSVTPTPSSQCTASWGDCTLSKCCSTSGQYCQPWSPGFYGCVTAPSQCKTQLTNIDLFGNDIKTVPASQPGDCCKACAETSGCKAYTFDNFRDGTPGCYLKSSADGARVSKAGLVSGIL